MSCHSVKWQLNELKSLCDFPSAWRLVWWGGGGGEKPLRTCGFFLTGHICPISYKNTGICHPLAPCRACTSPDHWQIRQGFPLLMDQQDLPAWSHPPLHFPGKFCFLINEEPALGCSIGRKDMLGSTGSTTSAPNGAQTPSNSLTSLPPHPKSISVL